MPADQPSSQSSAQIPPVVHEYSHKHDSTPYACGCMLRERPAPKRCPHHDREQIG